MVISTNQQPSSTVSLEGPNSGSHSGLPTTTPSQPSDSISIFTLMSRTSYIPPSTFTTTGFTGSTLDDSRNLVQEVHLEKLQEGRGNLTETRAEAKAETSLDDLLQTLSSLSTISANNSYFSPSSGWDNIKT